MTHTYSIAGVTCSGCETKVKSNLLTLNEVEGVEFSADRHSVTIQMMYHIPLSSLQSALDPKYHLSATHHSETAEQAKSWLVTYKPILLIFGYITAISVITALKMNGSLMKGMNTFMAGFFLTFSFFKMLDLRGFVESYSMYDIVAKRWKAWGYTYAFIELSLGLSYASAFSPTITNLVTLIVMSVSLIGVLQSVLNKRKIKCACLGAVFNLPMTTVTIIEDALMIAMSGIMLFVFA